MEKHCKVTSLVESLLAHHTALSAQHGTHPLLDAAAPGIDMDYPSAAARPGRLHENRAVTRQALLYRVNIDGFCRDGRELKIDLTPQSSHDIGRNAPVAQFPYTLNTVDAGHLGSISRKHLTRMMRPSPRSALIS